MPPEVPADVAYRAAVERAVRTTRALILAEAQIAVLEERVASLAREVRDLGNEVADYRESDEGVKHDGAEDGAGAGGAESAAGEPHPFHD